jgi:hypothetical protein
MHGVARNEHQVSRFDSPSFIAYPKSALTFYDQDELIVIRLLVNHILIHFEDIDVARQMLSVAQKSSLDGITSSGRVGSKPIKRIRKPMEVLRFHGACSAA